MAFLSTRNRQSTTAAGGAPAGSCFDCSIVLGVVEGSWYQVASDVEDEVRIPRADVARIHQARVGVVEFVPLSVLARPPTGSVVASAQGPHVVRDPNTVVYELFRFFVCVGGVRVKCILAYLRRRLGYGRGERGCYTVSYVCMCVRAHARMRVLLLRMDYRSSGGSRGGCEWASEREAAQKEGKRKRQRKKEHK